MYTTDVGVRMAAAMALWQSGDPRAVAALTRLAKDPEKMVSDSARTFLRDFSREQLEQARPHD